MSENMREQIIVALITGLIGLAGGFGGVFIGSHLSENAKLEENKRSMLMEVVTKSEMRTHRLMLAVWSIKIPDTFEKRWDNYIENAVVPWDSSYYRMQLGLSTLPNSQYYLQAMKEINEEYQKAHENVADNLHLNWVNKKDTNQLTINKIEKETAILREKSKQFSRIIWLEIANGDK